MMAALTCPYCGAALDFDSIFCTECGQPVASPGIAPIPDAASAPITETIVELPVGRICPHCNTPNDSDALFCIECGLRLEEDLSSAPPDLIGRDLPGRTVSESGSLHVFEGNTGDQAAEQAMQENFKKPSGID